MAASVADTRRKLAKLCQTCHCRFQAWQELQTGMVAAFSSCQNMLDRLPGLQDSRYYTGLPDRGLQQKLIAKHLCRIEEKLTILHSLKADQQQLVRDVEKLHTQAGRLCAPAAPHAAKAHSQHISELLDYVAALRTAWEMLKEDLQTKSAILGEVTYDCHATKLGALKALLDDHPCLDLEQMRLLEALVAKAAEDM